MAKEKLDKELINKDSIVTETKDKIEWPEETIEKLIKNEFQMDSIGCGDTSINMVEPIDDEDDNVDEAKDTANETEVEYNDVDYKSRGFKSLQEAIDFMEKPYFKGLGEADKREYKKWLIK